MHLCPKVCARQTAGKKKKKKKKREELPPPRLEMSKHPPVLSDFGPVCVNRATAKFPEKRGGRAELINIFGSSGRGQ